MVWTLLVAHLIGVAAAVRLGRFSMRAGLLTASIAPALTATWAIAKLIGSEPSARTDVHELVWVEGLELALRFRIDSLALLMTVLVSGIGALVFVYATGYFSPAAAGGTRFPATLLAFSTAMLGLVWADSIWTLFIFWELTSITSFLLVGHKNVSATVRDAARRALLITGGGGLVLLAGLMVLADATGTTTLSDLTPVEGRAAVVAAVLVMIGAATKSAQVPFHVWLPGAMAAPTPVSAYLHSATMVKAGVLLVAVVGPALRDLAAWTALGVAFGLTSMLWGAIGALRHRDAKLILAWGTVSQLGLLITMLSVGSAKATFAAISLLFAHALFKAALFLVVGEIDIRTGTRDIAALGGLARRMPIACAVAVVAGLSMAGAPPLLGFMAKEAAIEASLGLAGAERVIVLGGVVAGSVLTVAYTLRFLLGVFGSGPDTDVAPRRLAMTVPAVLLGAAGLIGYALANVVNGIVGPAAEELDADALTYDLIRWPGIKTAFVISMAIVAAGAVVGWWRSPRGRAVGQAPAAVGADLTDRAVDGFLNEAPRLTSFVQHGSLPVYLATLITASIAAGVAFVVDLSTERLVWWDHPVQGVLAVAIVASASFGPFVASRLGAALTLGAVGLGISGLFVVHGAPDLVVTQLLVETVIVVGFVLGLGHLARRFPDTSDAWKLTRAVLAVAGGLIVSLAMIAAGAAPTGEAPIAELTTEAVDEGGGKNVVNVILTDIRALDTLGEVVVLATVAVGILALARVRRRELMESPDTADLSGPAATNPGGSAR